ncbi:MAG TPA: hypothetical protein VG319_05000 [Polyangia bacterium]|nr:hypothetical protein [Polyangia bacterium]
MPTFEVSHARGWYEAECRELGITITARRLEEIEATARRSAARALGANTVVELVMTRKQDGILSRLAGFFSRSSREGHS